MKKKFKPILLILMTTCMLLTPMLASGTATINSGAGSVTGFVNSIQAMLAYQNEFNNASTARDYYEITTDPGFQQAAATLIDNYDYLVSYGWITEGYTENISFQESIKNLSQRVYELYNVSAAQYLNTISNRYFVQDIVNFIDSYRRLPDSLYTDPGYDVDDDNPYSDEWPYRFSPAYALRSGIYATLTMKMATRLGPNTAYSEELGTFPQDTAIRVFEQVMGNGIPWVMVEFTYKNRLYRAYTGMKRISVGQSVPWGNDDPAYAKTLRSTEAYYGPGYNYAQHPYDVPANTSLDVYLVENGFIMCDYDRDGELIRAYLPLDSRIQ
jgi:hypothetical protein